MNFSDVNFFGWIFLTSLAIFAIGAFGWYINRSMMELVSRLDRSGETPQHSYLQAWLLPKYRSGHDRFANQEFHENVDEKAKNGASRIALMLLAAGAAIQVVLWVYLFNFVEGPISFLNSAT